ncbi:MmcB family DNA repair protein [Celeribacter sp.]
MPPLAPARRKKMHMTFARTAAQRLYALRDPHGAGLGG